MSSSSNDTFALAREEAFKDFSYFDEETVPVVSTSGTPELAVSVLAETAESA